MLRGAALVPSPVQSGARRDGIAGIYGNPGNVESATYRIQRRRQSPNPTLSAKLCRLDSIIYKRLRNSRYNAVWRLHSLGLMMEAPTPNCADPLP